MEAGVYHGGQGGGAGVVLVCGEFFLGSLDGLGDLY